MIQISPVILVVGNPTEVGKMASLTVSLMDMSRHWPSSICHSVVWLERTNSMHFQSPSNFPQRRHAEPLVMVQEFDR